MNTKFTYLYRDADNYKRWNTCIVSGKATQEEIDTILGSLEDGEYFIPEAVDMPAERFEAYDPQADMDYFELQRDGITFTDEEPTCSLLISNLAKEFALSKDHWEDCVCLPF